MLAGVDHDAVPVIDVDDKITTEPEEFNMENRLKVTLRTMKNLIGEYSNYATAYLNRCPGTEEQKEKYRTYVDIISVLTGKSIKIGGLRQQCRTENSEYQGTPSEPHIPSVSESEAWRGQSPRR